MPRSGICLLQIRAGTTSRWLSVDVGYLLAYWRTSASAAAWSGSQREAKTVCAAGARPAPTS